MKLLIYSIEMYSCQNRIAFRIQYTDAMLVFKGVIAIFIFNFLKTVYLNNNNFLGQKISLPLVSYVLYSCSFVNVGYFHTHWYCGFAL